VTNVPATVTFLPSSVTVIGVRGESLLDCAMANAISIESECGGSCACTTCCVRILAGGAGLSAPEAPEIDRLELELKRGVNIRLACQALIVAGEITVDIAPFNNL
jgi:2Fe-2S ferredoxin